MTITVIQQRPVTRYNGEYYILNYGDFVKYGKLCDRLIYCASVRDVNDEKLVERMCPKSKFPNVTIEEVIKSPLKEILWPSSFNIKQIKKVVNEADLVVIKMPSITIGKWAYKYVKEIGKKYILEVIACAWDCFWYHDIRGKLMAPYSMWNAKKIMKDASNVIYVTDKFLQNRYPTKGHQIGCSNVMLDDADPKVLDERLKRLDTFDENSIIKIGTVGAVNVAFKGQEYVIRAVAQLVAEGHYYHYYLAGAGDNSYLKKLSEKLGVKDYIHFLGAVTHGEISEFYRSLDIYVHPSLAEGLPRVLIEAERQAVPACGANASGTPELLDEKFVFKKQSPSDISRVLKSFTRKVMREQAEKNFERSKLYSIEVLDKRRKDFYSEVMFND